MRWEEREASSLYRANLGHYSCGGLSRANNTRSRGMVHGGMKSERDGNKRGWLYENDIDEESRRERG